MNLFDYFECSGGADGAAVWAARAPRRPREDYDVKLIPRERDWHRDEASLDLLGRVEREPWVERLVRIGDEVRLRLSRAWIDATGCALEAGGSSEAALGDLAAGRRYAIQFWDPNATKALHVGHLRNLALGNAVAASLAQAGGRVERRSLISDAGRSMGEAMAGVLGSGRYARGWPDGDEKSDHFVGICYAAYVAANPPLAGAEGAPAEDSLTRELTVRGDSADELLRRVLEGDHEALQLWYKTRAWVMSGQRKTLARLGISFDRVYFESDFLADAATLATSGLDRGQLRRRDDGVVTYATGLEALTEFPLVRPDGVPTQHMRSLAYWMAAPDLDGATSLQVCGTEWVSHVTCRRRLMAEMRPATGAMHPSRDIFNGMVAEQKRALASSDGALLIDELADRLEAEIDADARRREVRARQPFPERIAAQVALGYFLPHPVAPSMELATRKLLQDGESLGWDLARAYARPSPAAVGVSSGAVRGDDPAYRFAVVQSELYRRHLRLAVERFDVRPLAHYLKHLAQWHLEGDHGVHVAHIVHTLLDRCARGLGLEAGS